MHVLSTAGHEHELHALFNTAPDLARYSTIGSSRDADASTSRTARLASSREPILRCCCNRASQLRAFYTVQLKNMFFVTR